jgi:hypothetical protein
MATVLVSALTARIRERCDMVGSTFVTDAATSLWAWVNEANQKLHGMLVEALGEEYVSSSAAITIVAGTTDYAVPTGLFKLYGIDATISGYTQSLRQYQRRERNLYKNANSGGIGGLTRYGLEVPHYSLVGSNIRLLPAPTSVFTCTVLYAPEATVLTAGTDTVNYPNGWERFIVIDAAIQCLAKEESDVRTLVAERDAIVKEIALAKEQRDLSMNHRVIELETLDVDPLW